MQTRKNNGDLYVQFGRIWSSLCIGWSLRRWLNSSIRDWFRFCVSFPTLDLVSAFTWLFPHTLKIKAMSNVNQELLTLYEHLRSPDGFWLCMRWSSLVFCVCLLCICLSYVLATCSFLYIDLNTLNKQIFDLPIILNLSVSDEGCSRDVPWSLSVIYLSTRGHWDCTTLKHFCIARGEAEGCTAVLNGGTISMSRVAT